jgi:hypothetical protein
MGIFAILTLCICTSALAAGPLQFEEVLEHSPSTIWSQNLNSKTLESVHAYDQHKKLSNGQGYGDSIRQLDLSRLCDSQILAWAKKHHCKEQDDFLKNSADNLPLHDSHGKTIPLISLICTDGGVVRLKPIGDPTSQKFSKPSVVKAMRFFGSENYANFSDEAFKVDNQGRAVPKWPDDLNTQLPGLQNASIKQKFVSDWGSDAHSELKICR